MPRLSANGKRQDGGLRDDRRRRFRAVRPDRLGDVFDLLFAEIREYDRQLVANLVAHYRRDTDCTGLGECFQPGGDVDPLAEQVSTVDHNVADMDADAEAHRLARDTAVAFQEDPQSHARALRCCHSVR